MNKFLSTSLRREFFFLVILPFCLWIGCFWAFISGHSAITMDDGNYYQQTGFFADNLIRGVYPMWDPTWYDGSPFNFFLRRIGELNPFYWIVTGLKFVGVPNLFAYTSFLVFYYFLAVLGIWLIARMLFKNRLAYTGASWIFLFSAWGGQLFYNYISLLLIPLVWFFYFLLAFAKEGKKHQFLGMFFTTALIVITYIPFFSLTPILLFFILCPLFFWKASLNFVQKIFSFIRTHKAFSAACILFFLIACTPAIDFYHASKQGDFVMPGRHASSQESSALGVGMDEVKVGDILAQGYFEKMFRDHQSLLSLDFFIPYFFFLVCLISVVNPLSKRSIFLLMNVFLLWIVCMTSTTPLYKFLYDHVFFFRYMRMISFLFWIALLPMAIILVMEQLGIFLKEYQGKKNYLLLGFIVLVHLLFGGWAVTQEGIAWTTWLALGLSLIFFTAVLLGQLNTRILLAIMLGTIASQTMEMCFYISRNAEPCLSTVGKFESLSANKFVLNLKNVDHVPQKEKNDVFLKRLEGGIYYGTPWYSDIYLGVPASSRNSFVANELYLIDNTVALDDNSPEFLRKLGELWHQKTNVALLAKEKLKPEDIRVLPSAAPLFEIVTNKTSSVKVLGFDVNTLRLKTELDRPKFLLWSDNYHPDWHAFINGKEVSLLRADHSFKGVWLPAGESTVLFRFSTPFEYFTAYLMLFLFAATLAVLVFLAFRERFCVGEGADDDF